MPRGRPPRGKGVKKQDVPPLSQPEVVPFLSVQPCLDTEELE